MGIVKETATAAFATTVVAMAYGAGTAIAAASLAKDATKWLAGQVRANN